MKNLFIVGAQRSGSSILRDTLHQHESISMAMPSKPEPKYFLRKYGLDKKEYKSLYFKNFSHETLYFGEKSTSYFESSLAAKNIFNTFPESKILIILRNPAERTWSNYKFSKLNKFEKLDFIEAIKPESEKREFSKVSVNPFAYISRSKYEKYLKIYKEIFPIKNIKILIFEEFIKDVSGSGIFDWLGIKKLNLTEISKVNSSYEEELPALQRIQLQKEFSPTIKFVEDFIGRDIESWRP